MAPAVVDSARQDAITTLQSGSQLVAEMKQEQGIGAGGGRTTVSVVREPGVCARMAATFNHIIPPGTTFAVLRVGPVYYARDPDQRRATGVFADSTFHVLLRLGAAVPDTADVREEAPPPVSRNAPTRLEHRVSPFSR
jgi:hypothetical protein